MPLPRVAVSVSRSAVNVGENVTVVAAARKAASRQKAQLQRKNGPRWVAVASTRLPARGSVKRVRFGVKIITVGSTAYRVALLRQGKVRPAVSRAVVVRGMLPQAPASDLVVTNTFSTSLRLAWKKPALQPGARVVVRRAAGATPPSSPTAGSSVPVAKDMRSAFDSSLAAETDYAYAVFVVGGRNLPAPAKISTATTRPVNSAGRLPDSTRFINGTDIIRGGAGSTPSRVTIVLKGGVTPPGVGGHLVVPPSTDFPDGMLGEVLSVTPIPGGTTSLEMEPGSMSDAFPNMAVDQNSAVEFEPVVEQSSSVSARASGPSASMALAPSAFECKRPNGSTANSADLFESGNPLPISVEFSNPRWIQNFDPGNWLLGRPGALLMQLSGEADITASLRAKVGEFSCELSPTWRRNHRLFRMRVGTVPGTPIPINVNLEVGLSFSVKGEAGIEFKQHRWWGFTVDKYGDNPLGVRRSGSVGPTTIDVSGAVAASADLFADVSVMTGGGYKSANAQAGLYGTIGPFIDVTAKRSTSAPQKVCITSNVGFRSKFGVRLELWVKRWNLELADVTWAKASVFDSCKAVAPSAGDGPDLGSGDVQATLRWSNNDDMDLHVIDPAGSEIWYRQGSSPSGGQLDHDKIPGCSASEFGNENVENIFWPSGGAPSGRYTVWVDQYDDCSAVNALWTLTVRVNGVVVINESGYGTSRQFTFTAG